MASCEYFKIWHFMPTQNNANSIIIHNDVDSRNLHCYLFIGKRRPTTLTLSVQNGKNTKPNQAKLHTQIKHLRLFSIYFHRRIFFSLSLSLSYDAECRLPIYRNCNVPLRIDLCLNSRIYAWHPADDVCLF